MVVFFAKLYIWLLSFIFLGIFVYWLKLKKNNGLPTQHQPALKIYVIGETGKGKTLLLVSLVEHLVKRMLEEKTYSFNLNYLDDKQERQLRELQILTSQPNHRSTKALVENERLLFEQEQSTSTPTQRPEDLYLLLKYKTKDQNKQLLCHFVDLPGSYFEDASNINAHHQLKDMIQDSSALIFVINALDLNLSNINKPLTHYYQYGEVIDSRLTQKSLPIVVAITQADRLNTFQVDRVKSQKKEYFANWLKHQSLYESTAIYDLYSAKRSSPHHQNLETLGKQLLFGLIDQHEKQQQESMIQQQAQLKKYIKFAIAGMLLFLMMLNYICYQKFQAEILGLEKEAIDVNSLNEHKSKIKEYTSPYSILLTRWMVGKKLLSIQPKINQRLVNDELTQVEIAVKQMMIFQHDYLDQKTKSEAYLEKIQAISAFFKSFNIDLFTTTEWDKLDRITRILNLKKAYEKVVELTQSDINEHLGISEYLEQKANIFRKATKILNQIHELLKNNPIKDEGDRDAIETYDIEIIQSLLLFLSSCSKCEQALYFNQKDLINTLVPLIEAYPLIAFPRSAKLKKKDDTLKIRYEEMEAFFWQRHWALLLENQKKLEKVHNGIIELTRNLKEFKKALFDLSLSMPDDIQSKYSSFVNQLISSYQPESLDKSPADKEIFEKENLLWLKGEAGNLGEIQLELQQLQYKFNQNLKALFANEKESIELDNLLIKTEDQLNQLNRYDEKTRESVDGKRKQFYERIKDIRDLKQRKKYLLEIKQLHCEEDKIDQSYSDADFSSFGTDYLSPYLRLIQSKSDIKNKTLFYLSFDIQDKSKNPQKHPFEIDWQLYDHLLFQILDEDLTIDDLELKNDDILKIKHDQGVKKLEFVFKGALSIFDLTHLKAPNGCTWEFQLQITLKPWLVELMYEGK